MIKSLVVLILLLAFSNAQPRSLLFHGEHVEDTM